jgi:hypothetical protein
MTTDPNALEPSQLLQYGRLAVTLATQINTIFGRVRRRRLESFLRDIGSVSDEMSENDRQRFEAYIDSPESQEWLADFAEQVVRTRSRLAIAALAILYANPIEESFSSDFKADAAIALEGIADETVNAFLILHSLRGTVSKDNGSVYLAETVVNRTLALKELGYSANRWVRVIGDLLRRGIVGGRFSGAGWFAGEDPWEQSFRFSEESELFFRLFSRARQALGLPPVVSETS